MTRSDVVLVLNAGSSSLKYQVVRLPSGEEVRGDHVERVGADGWDAAVNDVVTAVEAAGLADHLTAVGHRVVHGGDLHRVPTVIDDAIVGDLEALGRLAPLHNPPAVEGIRRARTAYPRVPHVAVFDTAFFSDLPAVATTYAIDHDVAAAEGIRRFGMHGISHEYVAGRAAELLDRDPTALNQITLHLGNGASAAAVRAGRPVETSMGLTPLEGLVMGTRGGDLDPGVLLHLLRHGGYDVDRLDDLLHHRSGLQGIAGASDFRDLVAAIDGGDDRARLAYDVYCHRIRKYVGAYLAVLDGADVVVFTGGVGENVPRVREDALARLDRLGIEVDTERNRAAGAGPAVISGSSSRVTVLVVPTNEELAIARKVAALAGG
ncbi:MULTISPECIES: acetate/propionate family kinase [Nocardioides]|uniref:Acetate kinase n=1 Tax=Nocardioides vastitatis TaxID=2568655 RepID=A0ABW0ZNL3_9ACTN|nr:acetate kinase [Nocardioides sp.]THJ06214.1 acetate kinase [Nocardioides sp.]